MRILFLSHYFPPEVNAPASRTYEHCRQWVKDGHQVTVVTCVPNHPAGKVFPGYRNRLRQTETRDGILVVRLWTYVTPNEGFLRRSLNYAMFMFMAILAAPFLPRCDVVVTTSPQFFNGLAGYFVSKLKRAPWVLEIRDLWPESILAVGAIANRSVIRALEWLERFAYRKADKIVVVTEAFKAHIRDCGIPVEKIEVIKNGVDLTLFTARPKDRQVAAELGLQGKFVVSYVGTHGMAHGLETILDAAAKLKDHDDIRFLMVGDGAGRKSLVERRDRMALGNVVMLGQQDRARMPGIWAVSDACLVVLRRLPLFQTVIPSKIFEIMAMGRPLILAVEGESRDIVTRAEAGVCIPPEDPQALADAVLALARDPARSAALGRKGLAYVAQHHDRIALARYYCQVLDNTIGAR
jgi:glycosyltransferase involved in cell wall biosynthesis